MKYLTLNNVDRDSLFVHDCENVISVYTVCISLVTTFEYELRFFVHEDLSAHLAKLYGIRS